MSVTLRLADEIDVSRGDMIVHTGSAPRATQRFDAMVVWLHERPLDQGEVVPPQAHHADRCGRRWKSIGFQIDLESLEHTKRPRRPSG